MQVTFELLAAIAAVAIFVAGGSWGLAWFFASRFKATEDRILKQVSQNRRNADAQFYSIGLRLMRIELMSGISEKMPDAIGNNSASDANGNGNGS